MPPMTPPQAFSARRNALAHSLLERGVTRAALPSGWARPRNFAHNVYPFRAESHFLYLTGLSREGCVLVFEDGTFRLYGTEQEPEAALWEGTQPRLTELAEELDLPARSIDALAPRPQAAVLPPQDDETASWLAALLDREISPQSGPDLREADALLADAMVALRLVHDDAAVTQLRHASKVSAHVHRRVMASGTRYRTEAAIRGGFIGRLASDRLELAYGPIVTRKGEILHAQDARESVRSGDLILCDVGGETREGWASDVTRTWPASGQFSSSQRELYELVLRVQQNCIEQIQPGLEFRQLHETAHHTLAEGLLELGILKGSWDAVIDQAAQAVFFPHGLGHLLGLDVHDMEDLGDRAGYAEGRQRDERPEMAALRLDRPLVPNMVVTIEPGFYQIPLLLDRAARNSHLKKLIDFERLSRYQDVRGIRIEDDVLVTTSGAELLSSSAPKKPCEIELLMA